ncbi:hypothetical protein CYMTET_16571 [Cymbomonas tetramitiformis]|uniref:DUF642 domain-containing protein n=1 Tax=Cymbomonas tetramitiformis TaxID=36881 RepID=A0AAE0GD48_9CHLO|nr:hypothetical protein CYMTET_16571 [Cymbomonas tetramitiformis]
MLLPESLQHGQGRRRKGREKSTAPTFLSCLVLVCWNLEHVGASLQNGNFEVDDITASKGWQYSSSVSGWVVATDGISLINQSNSDWGSLTSGDGTNYLGLQGRSAFASQILTDLSTTTTYELTFRTAGRPTVTSPSQVLKVTLESAVLYYQAPSTSAFERVSAFFVPPATRVNLKFENLSEDKDSVAESTLFADDVVLTVVAGLNSPRLANGDFETDSVTAVAGWEYIQAPSYWSSGGSAGSNGVTLIGQYNEAWGSLSSGNGDYFVALQGRHSYVSQTITGLSTAKTYYVVFSAAGRPHEGAEAGVQKLKVTLDDTTYVYLGYPSIEYFETVTYTYTPSASSVVLKFENYSDNDVGDVTVDRPIASVEARTTSAPQALNWSFHVVAGSEARLCNFTQLGVYGILGTVSYANSTVVRSSLSFPALDLSSFEDSAFNAAFRADFQESAARASSTAAENVVITNISSGSAVVTSDVSTFDDAAALEFVSVLERSASSVFGTTYGEVDSDDDTPFYMQLPVLIGGSFTALLLLLGIGYQLVQAFRRWQIRRMKDPLGILFLHPDEARVATKGQESSGAHGSSDLLQPKTPTKETSSDDDTLMSDNDLSAADADTSAAPAEKPAGDGESTNNADAPAPPEEGSTGEGESHRATSNSSTRGVARTAVPLVPPSPPGLILGADEERARAAGSTEGAKLAPNDIVSTAQVHVDAGDSADPTHNDPHGVPHSGSPRDTLSNAPDNAPHGDANEAAAVAPDTAKPPVAFSYKPLMQPAGAALPVAPPQTPPDATTVDRRPKLGGTVKSRSGSNTPGAEAGVAEAEVRDESAAIDVKAKTPPAVPKPAAPQPAAKAPPAVSAPAAPGAAAKAPPAVPKPAAPGAAAKAPPAVPKPAAPGPAAKAPPAVPKPAAPGAAAKAPPAMPKPAAPGPAAKAPPAVPKPAAPQPAAKAPPAVPKPAAPGAAAKAPPAVPKPAAPGPAAKAPLAVPKPAAPQPAAKAPPAVPKPAAPQPAAKAPPAVPKPAAPGPVAKAPPAVPKLAAPGAAAKAPPAVPKPAAPQPAAKTPPAVPKPAAPGPAAKAPPAVPKPAAPQPAAKAPPAVPKPAAPGPAAKAPPAVPKPAAPQPAAKAPPAVPKPAAPGAAAKAPPAVPKPAAPGAASKAPPPPAKLTAPQPAAKASPKAPDST